MRQLNTNKIMAGLITSALLLPTTLLADTTDQAKRLDEAMLLFLKNMSGLENIVEWVVIILGFAFIGWGLWMFVVKQSTNTQSITYKAIFGRIVIGAMMYCGAYFWLGSSAAVLHGKDVDGYTYINQNHSDYETGSYTGVKKCIDGGDCKRY